MTRDREELANDLHLYIINSDRKVPTHPMSYLRRLAIARLPDHERAREWLRTTTAGAQTYVREFPGTDLSELSPWVLLKTARDLETYYNEEVDDL